MPGQSHTPLQTEEDQAALRLAAGGAAALCTLVGIEGTFSRRLGAQWALAADGTSAGSLSDHCLEQELAARVTAIGGAGQPLLARYGQGSPYIDFRLPCGSGIDLLIEPRLDRERLAAAVARLDLREPASLALPVERPGLLTQRHYIPSLRLLILGSGAEAQQLAHLAGAFGLGFELHGPKSGLALGRSPQGLAADRWTAIVLLFHDHEWEQALLEWALATPAFYIGAQGGKPTRERRLTELRAAGHDDSQLCRIVSPIGLVKHARDPRTLALSVLAEVIAGYEELRQ